MNNLKLIMLLVLAASFTFVGCGDDEEDPIITTSTLTLDITGLQDLGNDFAYEGWIIVDGSPVSAGVFNVDDVGSLSSQSFTLDIEDLESATAYVLTIEPSPDNDPNPSSVHILAGDFSGSSASLVVEHASAIGTNFVDATGNYILATPTDGGSDTNERSGVWWLNPDGPSAGLSLPTLPDGWKYEGWVVVDGNPVSTGTFSSATGSDDAAPYSGTEAGPPFPGEDLLSNAPFGLTFPLDISERVVVVSVEPVPDNSTAPFLLKPLVGSVPANAADHTLYGMDNNAVPTNPTGTASR